MRKLALKSLLGLAAMLPVAALAMVNMAIISIALLFAHWLASGRTAARASANGTVRAGVSA